MVWSDAGRHGVKRRHRVCCDEGLVATQPTVSCVVAGVLSKVVMRDVVEWDDGVGWGDCAVSDDPSHSVLIPCGSSTILRILHGCPVLPTASGTWI